MPALGSNCRVGQNPCGFDVLSAPIVAAAFDTAQDVRSKRSRSMKLHAFRYPQQAVGDQGEEEDESHHNGLVEKDVSLRSVGSWRAEGAV
jgi:hypothetical protein